jgi:hypothetical protein
MPLRLVWKVPDEQCADPRLAKEKQESCGNQNNAKGNGIVLAGTEATLDPALGGVGVCGRQPTVAAGS